MAGSPRSPTRRHADSPSSPHERSSKRRRVTLACEKCRERKSRCDGEQPECGACRAAKSECSYLPLPSKTDQLRQEFTSMVEALDDRIGGVERLLLRFEKQLNDSLRGGHVRPLTHDEPQPMQPAAQTAGGDVLIPDSVLRSTSQPERETDGIGIVPVSLQRDSAFYGPSSNIAFLRLVSSALAKAIGRSTHIDEPRLPSGHAGGRRRPSSMVETARVQIMPPSSPEKSFAFPPEEKVRKLLQGWFISCGHVFAFVHEGRLVDSYDEHLRTGFTKVERSWLALMYMLFALAAISWPYRSSSWAHTNAEAESWYEASRALCMELVFSETEISIEVV